MKNKTILNTIFLMIFTFLIGCINIFAVDLRNYGGIAGYEYNGSNAYNCHGYKTGVIQIGDTSGNDYYCSQCGKDFPNTSWSGSTTTYSYTATGTCYYSCSDPDTGSYATTQHNIWDIMENSPSTISCSPTNSEISSACGGGLYLLTEYGYSSYQKVLSISYESYYVPVSQTIKVSKVCENGLTGSFKVQLLKNGSVYKEGTISCGEKEKQIFGSSLSTGTYTIREVEEREEVIYDTPGDITLTSGNTLTVTFTNSLRKGNIKVNKVCENGITGSFKVGIYKDNSLVEAKEISCGSSATWNLQIGTYTIKEIDLDSKYQETYSTSSIDVTENTTKEVTITNNYKKGNVEVTKECVNYLTEDLSTKFKITINNETKELICGETKTWELDHGTYTITEDVSNLKSVTTSIKVDSNSFVTSSSASIVVEPNETNKVIVKNTLQAGGIIITKKDVDTNEPIKGVKFKLYLINGNNKEDAKDINGNLLGIMETSETGVAAFDKLPYGKYELVEVENPLEGYVIAESKIINISEDTKYFRTNIFNKRIQLQISKVNIDGSVELENAKFTILDKTTKEVYREIVITKDLNSLVLKPGEYLIKEEEAPVGYQKLFDIIELKIDNKGQMTLNSKNDYVTLKNDDDKWVLTIKNDTRKVSISKIDITTNKELEGASFVLIKKGTVDEEIAKWTSSKTPYRLELEKGEYILKEVTVPKGYTNKPIEVSFTVDENSVITITSEKSNYYKSIDNELIIYNEKPIKVPDTGLNMKIGFIIIGVLLIGGGTYIIYKYGKKKK